MGYAETLAMRAVFPDARPCCVLLKGAVTDEVGWFLASCQGPQLLANQFGDPRFEGCCIPSEMGGDQCSRRVPQGVVCREGLRIKDIQCALKSSRDDLIRECGRINDGAPAYVEDQSIVGE